MNWTQHISKTWNRPYWFNSETKKSVWIKPDDEKLQLETDITKLEKSDSKTNKKSELKLNIDKLKKLELKSDTEKSNSQKSQFKLEIDKLKKNN